MNQNTLLFTNTLCPSVEQLKVPYQPNTIELLQRDAAEYIRSF